MKTVGEGDLLTACTVGGGGGGGGWLWVFFWGGRKKVHASEQAKITLAMGKIAKVHDSTKLLMGPKRK